MEWVEVCSIPSFFVIIHKHVFPEEYGTELQERQTHNCQIAMDVIIKPGNFKNNNDTAIEFFSQETCGYRPIFWKKEKQKQGSTLKAQSFERGLFP